MAPTCREKQSDGYGKSGDSVHGTVVIVPRYADDVEEKLQQLCSRNAPQDAIDAVLEGHDCVGFHKLSIVLAAEDCHTQDACSSLGMFEQSLEIVKEKFPWVRFVHLQADNASTYHSSLFIVGAWYVADNQGFQLLRFWNNTPGHGKDLVDHLFGALKGHAKRWIAAGADAPSSKHLIVLGSLGAALAFACSSCMVGHLPTHCAFKLSFGNCCVVSYIAHNTGTPSQLQLAVCCFAGQGLSGTVLAVAKFLDRKEFKVAFTGKGTLTGVKHWYDFQYITDGDGLQSIRVRQASGIGHGKLVTIDDQHDIQWHEDGDGATLTGVFCLLAESSHRVLVSLVSMCTSVEAVDM
jgi:hypothetical protein